MNQPKRITTLNSERLMKSILRISKSMNRNMGKSKESPVSPKEKLRSLPKNKRKDDFLQVS